MLTEQWQRIEDLFHAALDVAPEERTAYLFRECGGDEPLRLEVESLIKAFENDNSFIEEPALSLGIGVLCESMSGLLAGRSLGHYQVIRLLGEGGMGEVYLAEDRVLERQVALKFIANTLIDNDWSKEQLLNEARAVAKLENPNICAVYGVEHVDGHQFIVMQYVEGETLKSVLGRGAIDTKRTLEWAEQLAAALSAAHGRGIIHRDIKPQNIMVTPEGQLKVLDFGLAKFTRQINDQADNVEIETGVIAGTVAYMSPEQKRGDELDGRTDIFSFGIVLGEMLGWPNLSKSETDEETIATINSLPVNKVNGVNRQLRAGLERIVLKCLRKERELRYDSAEEFRSEIQGLRETLAANASGFWKRFGVAHYTVAATLLVLILLTGTILYRKITRTHTIAILPIVNLSQDPQRDYLKDGLTRILVDKFAYLPRLNAKLAAPRPNKNEPIDPVKVGHELQVDAVLTGELVREGEILKLQLHLIDTSRGAQTWARSFNVDETDLLSLQDAVTRDVTAELGMWLIGNERVLLGRRQTDNREAINDYMKGRHLWTFKRDRQKIQEAINYFERAKELDPAFAEAYSGLADCYALMTGTLYGPNSTKDAMEKAAWNANKAIELDPTLAEARTSLGLVALMYRWDWEESERQFKQAIEIQPDYAPARFWYSNLLAAQKRFAESINQGELAKSYDPYSRLADMNYGRALYYSRRFDEAASHFERLLKREPDYAQFMHMEGWVQIQLSHYDEAISILEALYQRDKLHAAAALGYAYGKAGKRDKALSIISELDELAKTLVVPPSEKAIIYIGLGDKDLAFQQLEICFQERNASLAFLTTDPLYDPLRDDPRFVDLAHRLKLQI